MIKIEQEKQVNVHDFSYDASVFVLTHPTGIIKIQGLANLDRVLCKGNFEVSTLTRDLVKMILNYRKVDFSSKDNTKRLIKKLLTV